jgi:hypothetical protein
LVVNYLLYSGLNYNACFNINSYPMVYSNPLGTEAQMF